MRDPVKLTILTEVPGIFVRAGTGEHSTGRITGPEIIAWIAHTRINIV